MQNWRIEGGKFLSDAGWQDEPLIFGDGRILSAAPANARSFDASDLYVLPGIVDLHGDAFERQWMPRANVTMPFNVALPENDRQLIGNGITTAFYSITISFEPGLRSADQAMALIDAIDRRAAGLSSDSLIHLRYEVRAREHLQLVEQLLKERRIHALSFNDHLSDHQRELGKPGKRESYFARSGLSPEAYTQMLDDLATQDDSEIDARIQHLAVCARQASIATMMHDPADADDIDLGARLGCEIAEFPMYEAAASRSKALGLPVVMGCPNVLRGKSHKGLASARELIKQGLCNILASDYYYPSLIAAVIELERSCGIDIDQGWRMISQWPAQASKLNDRGRLDIGLRGDAVLMSRTKIPEIVAVFTNGRLQLLKDASRI